jgi:polyhydroxybutyrate depolymerase
MKALAKILGFAVAALIVAALGFYFIEVYAPSPANPTLSAAIQQESIPIGSRTREFLEYVPHDISPHAPLVIVLHGALMDARSMREWTGYEFDRLADQHGFVVVYPDGYKHTWNDCHSQATFAAHTENIDDVEFVKGLIAREIAQRQIDEKHVYILGYSNGGQMALRFALQAPEQVAGIAIAGASLQAPEDSSCPEQGAVPLLVVQGEKDPIHPINGGKVTLLGFRYRGRVLSAFDTAQTFAKRLGVTSAPQEIHLDPQKSGDPTSADGFLWPGAPSPVVALYKIEDGGHVVPQPLFRYPRILGHTTTAVDMPKLMIEMFHISSK